MKNTKLISIFLGCLLTFNPFELTAAAAATPASATSSINPYLSQKEVARYPLFARFVECHALPEAYRATFAGNGRTDGFQKKIDKIENLPFYKKRDDIYRIISAQRMKKCIEKMKLHSLAVTEKYIGKNDAGWTVFSQEVKGHPLTQETPPPVKFNKERAEQLYTLAQETGFCNWGSVNPNWILRDNVLVCIDTDVDAFAEGLFESLDELCSSWGSFFTEEAFNFLESKKNELADLNVDDPEPPFESYDDPTLPFAEVIEEFRTLAHQSHKKTSDDEEPSEKCARKE